MRAQAGLTTVEFALVGAFALMLLFACIEVSRALYVWNTVGEATRRAAHIAAICPMNDPAIKQAALVVASGDQSTVLHGLSTSNVSVTYLDALGATTGTQSSVAYVSVSITGYTHTLLIPFVGSTLTVPPFRTTVPRESLGYLPDTDSYGCIEG